MTRSLPPQLGSHTPVSPTRPAAGLLGDGHLPPPRGRGQVRLVCTGKRCDVPQSAHPRWCRSPWLPSSRNPPGYRSGCACTIAVMRAEQLTDPVAYHGEGPVWSQRWGGLRWVDMLAGDILTLSASGVGRRHVGRIVAALRPRLQGGAVIGVERGFALTGRRRSSRSPPTSAVPTGSPSTRRAASGSLSTGAARCAATPPPTSSIRCSRCRPGRSQLAPSAAHAWASCSSRRPGRISSPVTIPWPGRCSVWSLACGPAGARVRRVMSRRAPIRADEIAGAAIAPSMVTTVARVGDAGLLAGFSAAGRGPRRRRARRGCPGRRPMRRGRPRPGRGSRG